MSIRTIYGKILHRSPIRSFATKWIQPISNHETGIEIYNCVAKKNVPLLLPNPNLATWYTCGPTVYDSSHIGHASSYVKIDIIQRILREYFNINLVTALNITDIDDKIINKSLLTNTTWQQISTQYETEFWSDMKQLNVQKPDIVLRVSENIPEIIDFVQKLLIEKRAYLGHKDGSIYFSVDSYTNYGKLQKLSESNIASDPTNNKNSIVDFALWKTKKHINDPGWLSPWGDGRPGWHIECSALASKIFGKSIDFHAGGLDLRFPHHENEEAQSCCYHKTNQWVNYWIHTGQLHVLGDDRKMSKSLGNAITIKKLLENYTSQQFRMACILSNYRNSMDFSDEMMRMARSTINNFFEFDENCQAYLDGKKLSSIDSNILLSQLKAATYNIDEALKDDFDTAKVITHLSELCKVTNKNINTKPKNYEGSSLDIVAAIKKFVNKTLTTFGFDDKKVLDKIPGELDSIELIDELIRVRSSVRSEAINIKNKNLLHICDVLRTSMKSRGLEIKDHNQGSSWKFRDPRIKS